MATKTTGWYCRHTASIVSSTNTTVTIKVECFWQNDGWYYQINYVSAWVYCNGQSIQVKNSGSINTTSNTQSVSCGSATFTINKGTSAKSITCYAKITSNSSYVSGTKTSTSSSVSVPAIPSYTVSYNANGGSGAPSSQTKWYGTNLTLSSSKPTRTGYSFQGWGTSSTDTSVDYSAGATYSANASIALYAIWKADTYTVSYNANGGSGAPSSQTKTYGVNLTLSSTKPTRTNYNFKGWGTSASATSVSYASGAKYTTNAAITLYAIWEVAYIKPRITGFEAARCDVNGNIADDGTYIKVAFSWATDKTVSSVKIEWKTSSDTVWSNATVSASGTSGSVSRIVGGGNINTEYAYTIQVTVADASGSNQASITIGSMAYPIDVLAEGKGIAFGKVADTEGYMDIGFSVKARKCIESVYDEVALKQTSPTTGTAISFGIGGSGYNRGIYDDTQGKWMLYADQNNNVKINSTGDFIVNDMLIAKNKVLWSGAYYMNAGQTITLSSAVSKQANGIILVFSGYNSNTGTVNNSGIHCYFVPKEVVSIYSGAGHNISFMQYEGSEYIYKYLYISDTQITGHNTNGTQLTTTTCAVKTLNRQSVLTRVIGI